MNILQHIGSVLKKILHIGEEAAAISEPIVDVAIPDIAPLYNSAIGLAIAAQATADATTGTGAQKLAQVLTTLTPLAQTFFQQNGIQMTDAQVSKWASAVVDTLALIAAPTTSAAATSAAPAAAAVTS